MEESYELLLVIALIILVFIFICLKDFLLIEKKSILLKDSLDQDYLSAIGMVRLDRV